MGDQLIINQPVSVISGDANKSQIIFLSQTSNYFLRPYTSSPTRALLSRHRLGRCMDRTSGVKFSSRSAELLQCSLKLLLPQLQKTRSCPSLVVSCPKFDVPHPKATCRTNHGDFISLGGQRLQNYRVVKCQFSTLSKTSKPNFTPKKSALFATIQVLKLYTCVHNEPK